MFYLFKESHSAFKNESFDKHFREHGDSSSFKTFCALRELSGLNIRISVPLCPKRCFISRSALNANVSFIYLGMSSDGWNRNKRRVNRRMTLSRLQTTARLMTASASLCFIQQSQGPVSLCPHTYTHTRTHRAIAMGTNPSMTIPISGE